MRPTKPCPSSPMRLASGTNASSRNSSALTMPAVAELAHGLAERDALVAEADHERRDPARARARLGLGEHDVVLGDAAVGDPRLLPAQPVAAVHARRERRHAGGVRAVVGLRRRERRERRPLAAQRLSSRCLLLLAAELEDRRGEEAARGHERPEPAVAPGELLEDQAVGDEAVDPAAAVGLGEHVRGQPERGRLVHDLELRLDVGVVDRARDGPQLPLRELVRERGEVALLVADAETDAGHGEPRSRVTERSFSLPQARPMRGSRRRLTRAWTCTAHWGQTPCVHARPCGTWHGACTLLRLEGTAKLAAWRLRACAPRRRAAGWRRRRRSGSTARRSCASCTRCCSRGASTSAGTCSSSRASCPARSTPARATRRRRSASPRPWRRTTWPRRCTATSACTSTAASSRGACSASTWAASAARRTAATRTCARRI